jgi:hypothetical protein
MAKQNWEIGQQVKVGFNTGLTVLAKIPTPGDYAPDAYILAKGDKYYSFVPHNGLTRITEDRVAEMILEGQKIREQYAAKQEVKEESLRKASEFQKKILENN